MSLRALQLDLKRLRGRKDRQASAARERVPPAEDRRRQRDETAARRHLGAELMLVEREVRPPSDAKHARKRGRDDSELG